MEIPDLEETNGGFDPRKMFLPALSLLFLVLAGWLLFSFLSKATAKEGTVYLGQADLRDYLDFAETAAITLNNISYTNMGQQRSDVSTILSDELLTYYNRYFYDPAFLRLIADRKLYVSFQKVERSTLDSRVGNTAAVRVIGFNTYHSDLTRTQAEYPFTLLLQVEKDPSGKFRVTKVKRL